MNLIEGADRREVLFFPECLDDYIPQDSPVRFIDAFVDSLDLKECGFSFPKQDINGRGRPAYHPVDLLKLFIYGYKNGLRSDKNELGPDGGRHGSGGRRGNEMGK